MCFLRQVDSKKLIKLQILSDFHLEHRDEDLNYNDFILPNKDNILALLGDIGSPYDLKLKNFLRWCSNNFYKVLYVPGNNEFYSLYGHSYVIIQRELESLCNLFSNVYYLDNMTYDIGNIRFIGSTLWSDIPNNKHEYITNLINDYKFIFRKLDVPMTPNDICIEYAKNKFFIENNIMKANTLNKQVVILTHHAPSFKETLNFNNDLKYSFASQLTCTNNNIRLWCCGHTHHNFHHWHEGYELISNQIGYALPIEGYKKDLVIHL